MAFRIALQKLCHFFTRFIYILAAWFMPQEVGGSQRYSRVFYMAASLIRGGCLLVNYRWSIFYFGNPTLAVVSAELANDPSKEQSCER